MPIIYSCLFCLFLLAYFQLIMPSGIGQKGKLAQHLPKLFPGRSRYWGPIIVTSIQALIAFPCASLNRLPVFGSVHLDRKTWLLALAFLALNMLVIDPLEWKFTSTTVRGRILNFIPHNNKERLIWIPVSIIISTSEEIVYRAAFFGLLFYLFANYWLAGIISAMIFAYAHRSYGPLSVVSTFFVGLGLQYFVHASGGLFLSIAIHFIHNFLSLIYGIRLEQPVAAVSAGAEGQKESLARRPSSKSGILT